jgi:hypothetical protein
MIGLGKLLLISGAVLLVAGALVLLAERAGLPLGRLPGDIVHRSRSGNFTFYFPVATSIVLSVILSLLLWLLSRR